MKSKITLKLSSRTCKVTLPFPECAFGVVEGACPKCGAADFKVAGTGRRIAADDRAYEADGVCLACDQYVGVLRLEVNTLFGVREDEAVARMGVKIY